jgi:hypothetical protein
MHVRNASAFCVPGWWRILWPSKFQKTYNLQKQFYFPTKAFSKLHSKRILQVYLEVESRFGIPFLTLRIED